MIVQSPENNAEAKMRAFCIPKREQKETSELDCEKLDDLEVGDQSSMTLALTQFAVYYLLK